MSISSGGGGGSGGSGSSGSSGSGSSGSSGGSGYSTCLYKSVFSLSMLDSFLTHLTQAKEEQL
jgi:hypothetical protein